jgi:hypothetical protein
LPLVARAQPQQPSEPRAPALGKKEAAIALAQVVDQGSEWEGLLAAGTRVGGNA